MTERLTAPRTLALTAAACLLTAASTNAEALFTGLPGSALPLVVPESASLVLLGAGLLALAGAVRRLTATAAPSSTSR
jgi:hypothetical protein